MEYAAMILLVLFVINSVILLIAKSNKMKTQNAGGEVKKYSLHQSIFSVFICAYDFPADSSSCGVL